MTDDDINKELAEVMGYEIFYCDDNPVVDMAGTVLAKDHKNERMRVIDYTDPAIFAECVKWLGDKHSISIFRDEEFGWFVTIKRIGIEPDFSVRDPDIYKAVAMARIKGAEK